MSLGRIIFSAMIMSSNVSVKYLDEVTERYFEEGSVLFIYTANASDLSGVFVKYWANSQIVTVETCASDIVPPKVNILAKPVKNIVVLFGKNVPEQKDFVNVMKCEGWNGSRWIIIIGYWDDVQVVRIVLERVWEYTRAFNVVVMMVMTSSVRFFTSYPYQGVGVEEVNVEELFPDKIPRDFNGSELNVATIAAEPYVLKPEIPMKYEDGIEVRILKTIIKKINMKVKYVTVPNGEDEWIFRVINGRVTGLFGLLHRHEADILFHGVRIRPDRFTVADIITIHTFDELVWVVPHKSYIFDWKSLFIMFSTELWCTILLVLVLTSVILYYLTKPYRNFTYMDAFFQVLAMTLFTSITYRHNGYLYRAFMFTVFYYTLIIVTSYQTSLITFLTSPRSARQYETLREAVDDGLIGYLFPSSIKGINQSDHDLWNVVLTPGRHVLTDDYSFSMSLSAYNKTGFSQQRRNVAEFEINKNLLNENNEPMVYIIPKKSDDYWIGMYTPHGHPLTNLFRKYTMSLFESGIFYYWEKDLKLMYHSKKARVDGEEDEAVKLSLTHLKGAFVVYLTLIFLAIAAFFLEIVWENWRTGKFCKSSTTGLGVNEAVNKFIFLKTRAKLERKKS